MENKTFKNVRTIKFKVNFEGNGCVNFDSHEQSSFLINNNIGPKSILKNKNIMLAKKNYIKMKNEDDYKTFFKYKVSSEAIRHDMYKEDIPFQNPNIVMLPNILYNAIAMPGYITRGYVFTRYKANSLKKKSVVTICDAEEIGEWRSEMAFDFHSRTGEKKTKEDSENKDIEISTSNDSKEDKDTTIYNVENVGKLIYQSEGYIDLTELQFISADVLYDRMSVDIDGGINEKLYKDALYRNFPNFKGDINYYYMKGTYSNDEWAERGVFFDADSVDLLVKDVLSRIMKVNILKRNAIFRFKNIDVEVICDDGESYNIDLNLKNLNEYKFEYYQKYFLASAEKIEKNKQMVEELKKETKENKKKK